jgi:hypothetical protein
VTSVFILSPSLIWGHISPRFPESGSGNACKTPRFFTSRNKPENAPDCQNNRIYQSKFIPQTWAFFHLAPALAYLSRDRVLQHHWKPFKKMGINLSILTK